MNLSEQLYSLYLFLVLQGLKHMQKLWTSLCPAALSTCNWFFSPASRCGRSATAPSQMRSAFRLTARGRVPGALRMSRNSWDLSEGWCCLHHPPLPCWCSLFKSEGKKQTGILFHWLLVDNVDHESEIACKTQMRKKKQYYGNGWQQVW